MNRIFLYILLACLGLSAGCDEAVRQPGEAGGECRLGSEPCTGELVCRDGLCQADAEDASPEALEIKFTISDRHIPADGETETVLLIQAQNAVSSEAFDGVLILYPTPYGAGRMEPGRVTFNDGIAQAVYVPCRSGDPVGCPDFVTISAARPEAPRVPIASSPAIRLFNPAETFESAVSDTACAPGEGKLALRPDLTQAEESLSLFSASSIRIDEDTNVLSVRSGGHQVGFRFDASNATSGTYGLDTTDVSVALNSESVNLPTQCVDSAGGNWTGNLKVMNATLNETGLQALSFFCEITCLSDDGQTVGIRACGNYVAAE